MKWKPLFTYLVAVAIVHAAVFFWFLGARDSFATSSTPIHLFSLMLLTSFVGATVLGALVCSDWANTKPSNMEEG